VPDFGSGSGKPRIRTFFGNPAKSSSGSGQISSQICQTPVHVQYVQLITDKTDAADLSSAVFAITISVACMMKIQNPAVLQKLAKH